MRSLNLRGSQQLSQQYKGLGTKGPDTCNCGNISSDIYQERCTYSLLLHPRWPLWISGKEKRNFLRVCKCKFRLVFSPVSSNRRFYLLQGGVRDPKAAEAHVCKCLLQLPEQAGVRSVFEASVGEQVGQLLTDGLNQPGLRDVVEDEAADALYVACKEQRRNLCSRRQHKP